MNTNKPIGRPREFSIDEALEAMVHVFWEKGYEGTSLSDILDSTGLQKGSLYKAFDNKHEMFLKALERYIAKTHADKKELIQKASSPLAGIEAMLKKVVEESCSKSSDFRGCLAVRSMMDRTSHDDDVLEILKSSVASAEKGLTELIEAGQAAGEIRCDQPARTLAEVLYCLMSGMLATSRIATKKARTDRLVAFGIAMLEAK